MPEEKEVTISDIAQFLKISTATISRALRDSYEISVPIKTLIAQTAKQMGYRSNSSASTLRTGKINLLGILVGNMMEKDNYEVLSAIETITTENGYALLVKQSLGSRKKEIENANYLLRKVAGLIMLDTCYTGKSLHLDQFIKRKVPVVFINQQESPSQCSSVSINFKQATFDAVAHLADQGSTHIAAAFSSKSKAVFNACVEGYKDALLYHHLPYNHNLILNSKFGANEGHILAENLLSQPQIPDGIFIPDDITAIHFMRTMIQHGIKVPLDIAIVGLGNNQLSSMIQPKLSSIGFKNSQIGTHAAGILMSSLKNKPEYPEHSLDFQGHELMIRCSSYRL
ncbi:LacI family transcriptional regulator [Pedobacter sp. MC2016-14]|uniref:LacI family DNA-binding transcriptional regulator n=1 Tax=Pedobacter sp. MC2016-14 TaxID=2897327 RepID=UPI001E29577D|nr:LacI family DNA-binding transcriptional regulator [Pedobacter sp. MC2016-14]MCD0489172.1 LacI family transcriptional regulator [Pedobacter sp. MC2016-14]